MLDADLLKITKELWDLQTNISGTRGKRSGDDQFRGEGKMIQGKGKPREPDDSKITHTMTFTRRAKWKQGIRGSHWEEWAKKKTRCCPINKVGKREA